eukprot:9431080-Heterocapsa_arctica.AAC.1
MRPFDPVLNVGGCNRYSIRRGGHRKQVALPNIEPRGRRGFRVLLLSAGPPRLLSTSRARPPSSRLLSPLPRARPLPRPTQ